MNPTTPTPARPVAAITPSARRRHAGPGKGRGNSLAATRPCGPRGAREYGWMSQDVREFLYLCALVFLLVYVYPWLCVIMGWPL